MGKPQAEKAQTSNTAAQTHGPGVDSNEREPGEVRLREFCESEAHYRDVFERSRDAIYVHDLKGRYVSVNRAAEELSGFTREEILGKHYSNFVAPRTLRNARENFCLKLDVPLETTYEAEIVCKNGARKPVEVVSQMIYENGIAIGVRGTARDISERKLAHELLQALRLVEAQEAERQEITHELHGEISQVLTGLKLSLQSIQKDCPIDALGSRFDESVEVIDRVLAKIQEAAK